MPARGGVPGLGRWWESMLSLCGAASDAPDVLDLFSLPAISAAAVWRASRAASASAVAPKRGTAAALPVLYWIFLNIKEGETGDGTFL